MAGGLPGGVSGLGNVNSEIKIDAGMVSLRQLIDTLGLG